MPVKATKGSRGYDLILPVDTNVQHGRQSIPLGFRIGLPEGYGALIIARSGHTAKGMECKFNWTPADKIDRADAEVKIGLVDDDYVGIVGVLFQSFEEEDFIIPAGTHIAQMLIVRLEDVEQEKAAFLESTERGEGGFGHSTDK